MWAEFMRSLCKKCGKEIGFKEWFTQGCRCDECKDK